MSALDSVISGLPTAGSLTGSEIAIVNQSGVTCQTTLTLIAALASSGSGGDMLVAATNVDNSATNANLTAAYDKWNVIKATTTNSGSNWAVTLPAPALSSGKRQFVAVQVDPASTELVTLNAHSGENIGPGTATSRILQAGEVCLLETNGTNWFKVAGITIPMACTMRLAATTTGGTYSSGQVHQINVDETDLDNTGLMADPSTYYRITIKRGGNYLVLGTVIGQDLTAAATRWIAFVDQNGTNIANSECPGVMGGYPAPSVMIVVAAAAGDTFTINLFQNSGSAQDVQGGPLSGGGAQAASQISVLELPSW